MRRIVVRNDGLIMWALIGIGALLLLNKLGIDLLSPNRKSDTYDDDKNKGKYDVDKSKVSYSKEAFERLCTRLVHAMDTDSPDGTYEDEIYEVFNYLHTNDDFKQLFNVFGTRTYSGDEWGQWQLEPDPKLNLQSWLNKELDTDEKARINRNLKEKGITLKI